MLPSRNQEIRQRQQPTANDTMSPTNHNSSSRLHSEIRTARHQHSQGYHPYSPSGTGYKHRKHRSQPINFFNDEYLYLSAQPRAGMMQPSMVQPNGISTYTLENQEEGRYGDDVRLHSILQSNKTHTSLEEVSENTHDTQLVDSSFEPSSTPPIAGNFTYLPMSPGSPHAGMLSRQPRLAQQFAQHSQLSNEIIPNTNTLKNQTRFQHTTPPPVVNHGLISKHRVFAQNQMSHFRRHSMDVSPYRQEEAFFASLHSGLPSPPNTAPLMSISQFDMAPMPHPAFQSITGLTMGQVDPNVDNYFSPESSTDDGKSIERPSPHMNAVDSFMTAQDYDTSSPCPLANSFMSVGSEGGLGVTLPTSHLPALAPAPSTISRLVPNASYQKEDVELIRDSGISSEEISAYISGPEAIDGKWVCLFPECNKRFGRKENIKSHVQTHLGDRQFQCEVCKKCFVRQHDLKRHSKIHTGVKPYPCKCGNSFARHDALTRHRQRGMCIGAFEGIVKKIVKRGRPKKIKDTSSGNDSAQDRNRNSSSQGESDTSSRSGSEETTPPPQENAQVTNASFSQPPHSITQQNAQPIQSDKGKRKRDQEEYDEVTDNDESYQMPATKKQFNRSSQAPESPGYSPPSSPLGDNVDEVSTPEHQTSYDETQFGSSDGNISFTPIASPDYDVIHRRYASVYNTPEWSGFPSGSGYLPSIIEQQVDLRDILGLSSIEEESNTLGFDLSNPGDWGKTAQMNLGMNMSLNMGVNLNMNMNMGMNINAELGLMGDGFDFIKSELLHDDNLELWANHES